MPYRNKQEAVDSLKPGWRITGEAPYMVAVPNPRAGFAGEPAQIQEQQGSILSIDNPSDPSDPPDTIVIKQVGNAPWRGGVGYDVIQGPQKAVPKDPTKPTPSAQLDKLDADGNPIPAGATTKPSFVRDPATGQVFQTDASTTSDPSTWQPVYDPNDTRTVNRTVIGLWDPANNKMAATVPQTNTQAKPSGEYEPVKITNADGTERVVAIRDKGDNSFHPVAADPTTNKRLIQTPTAVYSVDDNDKIVKLLDIDKSSPYQAVVIDGIPYSFDPNEKDPNKRFSKAPGDWQHPPIKDANGNPMQWDEAAGKYSYPPGVTPAATVSTNTTAPNLEWYDAQGNLIKSVPNSNYAGVPQPTQSAQSTTAPQIQQWNPKTGQWEWVENKGRIVASQALQDMASQLSGQVVAGDISMDEAKLLIEAANTRMTQDINKMNVAQAAAGNVLDYTSKSAATGAGLLQQRAQTAQGMVNNVLGLAGQRSPSGNYGGGMLSAPAGLGSMLTEGAAAYSADLMGGQSVMDTAASLIRQADPKGDMASPAMQTAIGALTQMLDKYQELNGKPHPAAATIGAAQQSAATNGLAAPATVATTPAAFTAPQYPVMSPLGGGVANSLGGVMQTYGPPPETAEQSVARNAFTAPAPTTVNINL